MNGIQHDILQYGDLVFLVNCVVYKDKITAGFAFFEGGCPAVIPLRTTAYVLVGKYRLPEEAKDNVHPVAMGDLGSPIELINNEKNSVQECP